jgi:L-2-hydroxyglutarate oxidase LhgO
MIKTIVIGAGVMGASVAYRGFIQQVSYSLNVVSVLFE